MTTQLGLYNGALRIVKERKLADLTERCESRYLLDDAWGEGPTGDGAVKFCLEQGQWTFATRTVQSDYSPSIEPDFGHRYAFDQPEDMVDVCGIYQDSGLQIPLTSYRDERHFWFADQPTIYVSYVSNHEDYGGDMSLWPETFKKLVEAFLATEIAANLTQGNDRIALADRAYSKALLEARSGDAMRKPTKFPPVGSWVSARYGGGWRNSRWDQRSG